MIKNIFIPEKIGNYYIFSKRILSFDIGRTHIHAAQIYLHGSTIRIEKFIEEKIELGPTATQQERTVNAIKNVVAQSDKFQAVYSALSSSNVVFKELKVPFLDYEKIKMVVNFEVEPLLPFSLSSAVVDFIITKQNVAESSSNIMVAAALNENLSSHISMFTEAGLSPDVISVDLFGLYGLYMLIPEYQSYTDDVALIDFDIYSTRIAYISDKQLKFVRTLPKGLTHLAKMLADELKIQPSEAMENIMRFGLTIAGNELYNSTITRVLTSFWSDIDFTLRSFALQTGPEVTTKLLLTGRGSEISELPKFVTTVINRPCQSFSMASLFENTRIVLKNAHYVPRSHFICLSCAFPCIITHNFNLARQEFEPSDKGLFNKQFIVACSLFITMLVLLLAFSFWRLHSLKSEFRLSSAQAINELKKEIPGLSGSEINSITKNANTKLEKEEQVFALTDPDRPSMLTYLLELTKKIDKKTVGLVVYSLSIEGNNMVLKAKVKDYPALNILEKNLRDSKIFEFKQLQTIEFDLPIKIVQPVEEV